MSLFYFLNQTIKKPSAWHSAGGEEAVSHIPETGDDVRVRVELRVDVRDVYLDVRVVAFEADDPRGAAQDADEDDLRGAGVLEVRDRVRRAAAGREHGVQDEVRMLRVHGRRHGAAAEDRSVGLVVTRDAHVTDQRIRQEGQERLLHAVARAHDGNQHRLAEERFAVCRPQNGLDRHRCRREALGCSLCEHQADPVTLPANLIAWSSLVPQPRHGGFDDGMVHWGKGH